MAPPLHPTQFSIECANFRRVYPPAIRGGVNGIRDVRAATRRASEARRDRQERLGGEIMIFTVQPTIVMIHNECPARCSEGHLDGQHTMTLIG